MTTTSNFEIMSCKAQLQQMINMLHHRLRESRDPQFYNSLLNQLEQALLTLDKITD